MYYNINTDIKGETSSTLQWLLSPPELSRIRLSNLLNPVDEDAVEEVLTVEDRGEMAADILREDTGMRMDGGEGEEDPAEFISHADQ